MGAFAGGAEVSERYNYGALADHLRQIAKSQALSRQGEKACELAADALAHAAKVEADYAALKANVNELVEARKLWEAARCAGLFR